MTLRAKVSLIFALIILSSLAITGVFFLNFLRESLRTSVLAGLNGVTSTSSEAVEKFLLDKLDEAQAVAQSLSLDAQESHDVSRIEERLRLFSTIFPGFDNGLFLLDPEGRVLVDYPSHPEIWGQSFAHREYFQRTIKEGKGIVAAPYQSARTREPVVTFTSIVRGSSNEMLGVLGCSVRLLSPNALGGLRKTKIGQTGYLYIFDSSRLMVLHPENDRILARDVPPGANTLWDAALDGFEGEGETVNSRGVPMLVSIKRIPITDWILAAQQPKSEAFAPLTPAIHGIMLGIVLAVLVSISVGAFCIRRITAPLMRLREVALKIGIYAGRDGTPALEDTRDLREEMGGIRTGDEIAVLVHAFQEMWEKLDSAMNSLKHAARDWERTFESVPAAIFITDQEKRILRMNRSAAGVFGVEPDSMIGRPCHGLVHRCESCPGLCPDLERLLEKRLVDFELYEPSVGRSFHVTVTPLLDEKENVLGTVHVMSDITERKKTEQALRESEKKYRDLADMLPQTVFECDPAGNLIYVNKNSFDTFRYTQEDFKRGLNVFQVIAPEDHERAREGFLKSLMGEERIEASYTALRKDGTTFPFVVFPTPMIRDNQTIGLRGILIDITERKKAEDTLRLNRMRLEALLKISQMSELSVKQIIEFALEEGVRLTGSRMGYIAFANADESVLEMYSWSKEAMHQCAMGEKPLIYPVKNTGLWGEAVRQRKAIITNDYDAPNPLKKGYPAGHAEILRHMNVPVLDNGRIVIVAGVGNKEDPYDESDLRQLTLLMDAMWKIIQRKRAEEERERLQVQLTQAQRMEAIGTLAGGIAHDFNNILAAIMGYTEMALGDLPPRSIAVKNGLEHVLAATHRARDLVRQILVFSRQSNQQEKAPVLIAPIIKEALKMLRASLPTTIDVRWEISCEMGMALADPTQIHQVIVNLCTNAAHAMDDKGTLFVTLTSEALGQEVSQSLQDLSPGRYLHLSVTDTGHGMDAATMERIFEPYFTTKESGKGTGLGLAVVHGVVKRHDGAITVRSELGKGTRFDIYIPQIAGEAQGTTEVDSPPHRGNGRVLFVDDEEMIVGIARQMLRQLGYEVRATTSSSEALELFRSDPGSFDLLISDYTMPGLTGAELAKEILAVRSDIPVILCTGYSERFTEEQATAMGIYAFAMKPISHQKLAALMKSALENHSRGADTSNANLVSWH